MGQDKLVHTLLVVVFICRHFRLLDYLHVAHKHNAMFNLDSDFEKNGYVRSGVFEEEESSEQHCE